MKMDQLVKSYIQVRSKKSQLKKEYENEVARYDELQDKIEALLLQRFGEMGIESIRTDEGTAYVSVRTTTSLADWDVYKAFCAKQEDPYGYLERRVNKAAIEQYKSANDDQLPPGINWSATRTVNFRK
jgi:hypothetical protein